MTRKACQNSTQFADLVRRIKLRSSNQQMVITLDELLHKPVARIQRHVAVVQVYYLQKKTIWRGVHTTLNLGFA